jgi:hypothetical protein
MYKEVSIDYVDTGASLTVGALIDADSGRFRITLSESRSLGMYRRGLNDAKSVIHPGVITLYKDGDDTPLLVHHSSGNGFDLSWFKGDSSGYHFDTVGLTLMEGATYRLVCDVEGYPQATAVAVMPAAPIIDGWSIDTMSHPLTREKLSDIYGYWGSGLSMYDDVSPQFCPFTLRIRDNSSADKDYYLLWVETTRRTTMPYSNVIYYDDDYYDYWENVRDTTLVRSGESYVLTENVALIQSSPDMAEGGLIAVDNEYDAYSFRRLMFSDVTFAGGSASLVFLMVDKDVREIRKSHPYLPGEVRVVPLSTEVLVSHISGAGYDSYRSLVMQSSGVGFFTEPVQMSYNVVGGVGCFAAVNTWRCKVK